jgi:hypothetical protein
MASSKFSYRQIPISDVSGPLIGSLSILLNASKDAPLAIVLGWTGSTPAALEKSAAAYRDRGFHVAVLASRFRLGISFSVYDLDALVKELDPFASILLRELPDAFRQPGPNIVVHLFSNGGAHTLYMLLENLGKRTLAGDISPNMKNAALLVADSSPYIALVSESGYMRQLNPRAISAIANFFVPILGVKSNLPVRILTLVMSFASIVGVGLARPFIALVKPELISNMGEEMKKGLRHPDFDGASRLFLCGTGDAIVYPEDVKEFAGAEEKRLGKPMEVAVFEGTGHVAHAAGWKGKYWAEVDRALAKVGISGLRKLSRL